MQKLKIIFMGTPDFSVPTLNALINAGHEIACVYTQPPRPAGRGQTLKKSPVHIRADELGLEVRHPVNFKSDSDIHAFQELKADCAVVVAYGLILPELILNAPQYGCINVHASLLPRWRGAAPIQRAIMAGDHETGISIMKMDKGLDTGDVINMEKLPITDKMTAQQLHDTLSQLGGDMIASALEGFITGRLKPIPQAEEGVTYAKKIEKSEGRLDWTLTACELLRQIRALSPFPGCYFEWDKARIKVLDAELVNMTNTPGFVCCDSLIVGCGKDSLKINKLQKAGKKPMTADEFQRGNKIDCGRHLPY